MKKFYQHKKREMIKSYEEWRRKEVAYCKKLIETKKEYKHYTLENLVHISIQKNYLFRDLEEIILSKEDMLCYFKVKKPTTVKGLEFESEALYPIFQNKRHHIICLAENKQLYIEKEAIAPMLEEWRVDTVYLPFNTHEYILKELLEARGYVFTSLSGGLLKGVFVTNEAVQGGERHCFGMSI